MKYIYIIYFKSSELSVLAFFFGLFFTQASANVLFSNLPLIGYSRLAPNVLLMLSVEYPTAGSLYIPSTITYNDFKKNTYVGYFSSTLCYTYINGSDVNNANAKNENGYFVPTSQASSEHLCKGNKPEFSGNLLNFMTMTTIDAFRLSLTGGNRAKGIDASVASYANGDTPNATFLRRAMVQSGKNQTVSLYNRQLFATEAETRTITPYNIANPWFHNGEIYGYGNKYSMYMTTGQVIKDDPATHIPYTIAGRLQVFTVNVQVCGDDPEFREVNCVFYQGTKKYKPEGLIQHYKDSIRFGIFGYLNRNTYEDGGIMRARLKLISEEATVRSKSKPSNEYILGQEVNPETGQFIANPDVNDAQKSYSGAVQNSGVINYLNKFGDVSGYKVYDPVGRLYYAGLRYLKGLPNPAGWSNFATKDNNDNFPVITDWDDPIKTDSDRGCVRKNQLIILGDRITFDNDTTSKGAGNGFRLPSYNAPLPQFVDDPINYKSLSDMILTREGNIQQTASNKQTAYPLMGLAYHAWTANLRPDLNAKFYNASTFTVDVLHNGLLYDGDVQYNSGRYNPYFMTAKYGGFKDLNGDGWPGPDRAEWTDDPDDTTATSFQFAGGLPRNFGTANDPSRLNASFKLAFSVISAEASTQAAITTPVESGAAVSPTNPSLRIITQYSTKMWSGNVIAKNSNNVTVWNLADSLNTQLGGESWKSRKVYVYDNGEAKVFNSARLDDLSPAKQAALKMNGNDPKAIIDYILGDKTNEGVAGDTSFRLREKSLLGTIVNSPVAYLPSLKVENNLGGCSYASSSKPALSYAFAANDGMLHIFNSSNRKEQMAFMATTLFEAAQTDATISKGVRYTQKNYEHEYINDGIPVTREMCFPDNNTIKSILVGTVGRGGHSVYAIDGTDLDNASAQNILWEFTNNDDADLSLTVNTPILTYDHDKRPIAIVSSGYNAPSGNTYVFVLRLDKSKFENWIINRNYYKIAVGSNSSGLGEIEVVDGDDGFQPDRLYVGDQEGRLWKIDTTDPDIEYWHNSLAVGTPLFTAENDGVVQPITAKPTFVNLGGNNYIYFGTGRAFSDADAAMTKQSLYAIIDKDDGVIDNENLLKQNANTESDINTMSDNSLLYQTSEEELTSIHTGWRFDLPDRLRVISPIIHYHGAIFAPIFEPSLPLGSSSGCSDNASRSGMVMLDAANGGMSEKPLVDVNGDNVINLKDQLGGMILYKNMSSFSLIQSKYGPLMVGVDASGKLEGLLVGRPTTPFRIYLRKRF